MNGGIISGPTIVSEVKEGNIVIEPGFDEKRVNPASYDLTLGAQVAVYKKVVSFVVRGSRYTLHDDGTFRTWHGDPLNLSSREIDIDRRMEVESACILRSDDKNEVLTFEMDREDGWLLKPGIGYLMHTAERIWTTKYVPVLDGKSSLGRLFMTAHVTAGYGDPGFNGQYTLEVVVTHPVVVYPGMRFCQIRFHTYVGEHLHYETTGHYTGALAEGPVPSMSWKQFEEERESK